MKQSMFSGLGTALVTPFLQDKSIDFNSLKALVERQITAGVDYLVVLGTTAEAATMTENEKRQIRSCIIEQTQGRVPLVIGIGGNNTAAVVAALQNDDLTGFGAVLSVCPYYNKPSQEGLFQHFMTIAQASPLPIILYNVPSRTGVNLLPQTVSRLKNALPDKFLGIKEASGNVEQIREVISLIGNEMLVISGDDGITAQLMQDGADGLISVASNLYPTEFRHIVYNIDNQAQTLQNNFDPFVRMIFEEGNPVGIKAAMSSCGLLQNELRLPLVNSSEALYNRLADFVRYTDACTH